MLKKYLIALFVVSGMLSCLYAQSPNEIRYNGKLKEFRQETNGTKTMNFKIYDQLTGGTAKWESGEKSVKVSSGIFSYTFSPDTAQVDWSKKDFYLELVIDGKVLSPREKLTSVPYSLHSTTADNITPKTQNEDFFVKVGETNYYLVPQGAIIIWSGSVNNIPSGWVLCDGTNGTPNLTDKFVLGAGNNYIVGATGGEAEHTLTIDEMPSHSHKYTSPIKGRDGLSSGNHYGNETYRNPDIDGDNTEYIGGSQPHNNMPPYYSLCYIMRK